MVNGYLTDFDRLNMYCIDASCHFIGFPRKISEMPRGLRDFVISCVPWQLMLFLLLFSCGFNCCRKKHVCLKKYTMMTLMIQMIIDFDRPKRLQYCVIRREVYSTLCVWPWATQVRMVSKLDSTGGSCLQLSWHYDILNGGWLATLQQSNTAMDVGSFQWEIMEHIMDMFLGFSWIFHFQLRLNTSWWNITTNTSIPSWNCRASLGSENRVPHCIRYLGIVVPDFQTDPHNNYIYIQLYILDCLWNHHYIPIVSPFPLLM